LPMDRQWILEHPKSVVDFITISSQ
jgi:hypothetical protein